MRIVKFDIYSRNKATIETDLLPILREKLSVENKNARFIDNDHISSRIYGISVTGRFEIGLFNTIKKLIDAMDVQVEYVYSKSFVSACMPRFECYNSDLETLSLDPYEYQEKIAKMMLMFGRGTILVGTGGGKTFIMSLFVRTLRKHTKNMKFLVIVPTIQLVEQTYGDFLEYGFEDECISKWSGRNTFTNTDIIVASSSILLSKKSDLKFLFDIDVLLVDEVHGLKKGNAISKLIGKIPTPNRFGFTGTMPEETSDQWNVLGSIGPILVEKDSSELREEKYIAEAQIDILKVNYNGSSIRRLHEMMEAGDNKYITELDFMIENDYRNGMLCKMAYTSVGNSLIMVDRIVHGEMLFDILENSTTDNQIYFIQGEVDVDERELVRDIMERDDNVICIAISKIFSTGINIKNIRNIIFATPGKAKVKLIQSIGRGLRLHENKDLLHVYDFADNLHYSNRHLQKREKLYGAEKLNYEIRNIRE